MAETNLETLVTNNFSFCCTPLYILINFNRYMFPVIKICVKFKLQLF